MRIQEIIDPLHLLFARLAFSAIDDVKTRTQHGFGWDNLVHQDTVYLEVSPVFEVKDQSHFDDSSFIRIEKYVIYYKSRSIS